MWSLFWIVVILIATSILGFGEKLESIFKRVKQNPPLFWKLLKRGLIRLSLTIVIVVASICQYVCSEQASKIQESIAKEEQRIRDSTNNGKLDSMKKSNDDHSERIISSLARNNLVYDSSAKVVIAMIRDSIKMQTTYYNANEPDINVCGIELKRNVYDTLLHFEISLCCKQAAAYNLKGEVLSLIDFGNKNILASQHSMEITAPNFSAGDRKIYKDVIKISPRLPLPIKRVHFLVTGTYQTSLDKKKSRNVNLELLYLYDMTDKTLRQLNSSKDYESIKQFIEGINKMQGVFK